MRCTMRYLPVLFVAAAASEVHQQFEIPVQGYTVRVNRYSDDRDTPYRIYFQIEHLTGSSYRFDAKGNLVYFKAGPEIYSKVSINDANGEVEFKRKTESPREKKHDHDKADYVWEPFSCNQCMEVLDDLCFGEGNGTSLLEFCGAVDFHALGSAGALSAKLLCDNRETVCARASAACDARCSGYVEAGSVTKVAVTATAYDERPGDDNGCGEMGCTPMLAYDGVMDETESRWSCAKKIVPDGGQCKITFELKHRQDVMGMKMSFWKGDQRTRSFKVTMDGHKMGEFTSEPGSITTSLGVKKDHVRTVTIESLGLDDDEWISLLEVQLLVDP